MSQIIQTPEQQYYLAKLLGYDYDIQYKSRASNVVVHSLSRINLVQGGQCLILFVPNFVFIDQLKQTLVTSSTFQSQLESI